MRRSALCGVAFGAVLGVVAGAASGGTQEWAFSLSTSGEDVFWMSPTPVDPAAVVYKSSYEITSVMATVLVFGAPLSVNVTDELDPKLLMGMGSAEGPAPLLLFDQFIASPPPPEDPSVAATVRIELDLNGFGMASATGVTLGMVTENIPPFGNITVPIQSISVAGSVTVTPVLTRPEDLDGDGVVGSGDLGILLASWGPCPVGAPCPADLDGDGAVGSGDLGILLAAWGM